MLVLSRKVGEKIVIGDGNGGTIVVTIAELGWKKVRLAIEAPAGVSVHRQEVHEAIQRCSLASANNDGHPFQSPQL